MHKHLQPLYSLGLWVTVMAFTCSNYSQAQKIQTTQLNARIIRLDSFLPIGFAHIKNLNRGYGTIADSSGWFNMHIGVHDTLSITAIGYQPMLFTLPDSVKASKQLIQTIKLEQRTYMLGSVDVFPYTWEEFKAAIINAPETTDKFIDKSLLKLSKEEIAGYNLQANQSISFALPNKRDRSMAKLKELVAQAHIEAIIDKKFNVSMIKELTGVEDESYLIRFIDYCGFSSTYLLETTEYDIISAVERKHRSFKLQHSKKE